MPTVNTAERYRLVRTVASGGMAQVIEAVAFGQAGFERRVAIKRLLPQHARDGERRRMFFEEARIGSRMHHGGIVPIFDYGLIDGSEFMAMEYVEGLDALRAVSGPTPDIVPMPEGIALHITAEIAHALAYIHDLRDEDNRALAIVHRDVSPPNILLSWNGDVKLSDFGIALSRAPSGRRRERTNPPRRHTGQASLHGAGAGAGRAGRRGGGHLRAGRDAGCIARRRRARTCQIGGERERPRAGGAGRGLSLPVCALIRSCLARDAEVPAQRGRRRGARRRARVADAGNRRPRRAAGVAGTDPCAHGPLDALDDLMGLCLVPVAGEGARAFTFSRVWETPSARPRHRQSAAARSRKPMFAAVAMTIALAAVAFAWRTVRHSKAETPFEAARVAAPPGGERLQVAPPVAAPAPAATSVTPAPTRAGPATVPGGEPMRGWLRVGGATLVGARVQADGDFVGFAPVELSLPVGSHVVLVTSDSGRALVRKRVRIGEAQTRLTPLRILR